MHLRLHVYGYALFPNIHPSPMIYINLIALSLWGVFARLIFLAQFG